MLKVKKEYIKVWKKGKTRFEGKDMADTWTTVEWVVFEYFRPRGMSMSFPKPGSMDDDEGGLDRSREGARSVAKMNKTAKIESSSRVPTNEKAKARAAVAEEIAAHTKMANARLIVSFGARRIGRRCSLRLRRISHQWQLKIMMMKRA